MIVENIKAAIAHLEAIAKDVEQGIEHDAEIVTAKVNAFFHYGPTLGQAPAVAEPAAEQAAEPAAGVDDLEEPQA